MLFTKLTVKAGVTIRLNGFSLFVSECNGPLFESLFRVVSNKEEHCAQHGCGAVMIDAEGKDLRVDHGDGWMRCPRCGMS